MSSEKTSGVVYLHGFGGSPNGNKATRFAAALEADGFAVRRPDLNANARGEEDFTHLTVTRALEAARASLFDRTVLVGSSMGAYLATLLASQDPRPQALVLMAPAFDLGDRLEARWGGPEVIERWRTEGFLEVCHPHYGEKRPLHYGWVLDVRKHPGRPPITRPAYVLAALRDDIVPIALVREVVGADPQVTLVEVDDEHPLVDSAHLAIEAARALARRHLAGG